MRVFFTRILGLFRRRDDQLSEEIQTHLELLTEQHVDRGLTPIDARAAARRAFGGIAAMKDAYRDQRRLPFFDVLAQDVRYALRTFRRAPAFTAATVITLALGIGATTAIFAIVDAVLLKPLPYPRADRMLALGSTAFGISGAHTGQTFLYLRDRVPAFARLAASRGGSGWNLVVGERAEYVRGVAVTPGYFEVFGMRPQAGREFSEAEGQPNGPMGVVISDAVWRRHFDGRAGAIGEIAQLGGVAHTVVGVMPPAFRSIPPADVWTALRLSPADNSLNYTIIGRLRNEASWESATAALETIKPAMVRDLGGTSQAFPRRIEYLTWMPYRTTVASGSRPILRLLFGAAGFVLLIACANVAALQLVRAVARRREMATRAVLGGGTVRAIRQVLTESLVLAIAGALAGLAVAQASLSATLPLLTESFLIGQRVSLDWRVFVAAVGLAVVTSIAFGLWPAIDTARMNLRGVVWESGRHATTSRAGTRLRRAFAILEVCLAGVLLVGAGLFVRAIVNLTSVDVGFDPDHVLVAQTSLQGGAGGTGLERTELFERVLARMRDVPGVEAAAVGTNVPIERVTNLAIEPAGQIRDTRSMDWMYVSPEYFSVFRMALRAGRPFDRRDDSAAPPAAIVNETLARTYFGTPIAALGQTIQLVRAMPDNPRTVVGVVGDVRTASGAGWTSGHALAAPPPPIIYVPVGQVPDRLALMVHGIRPVSWAVRSRGSDAALIPSIQQIMREVAPALPVTRFTTMEGLIGDSIQLQRTLMMVLGLFAAVALTLAAVGLYGVVAYGVAVRTREIGIRMALGATVTRVLRGFFTEGLATAVVGATLGLAIAAGLSRFLTAFVVGISPLDPSTYAAAAVVLLAIAGLASFIPSARAARVSPVDALRSE